MREANLDHRNNSLAVTKNKMYQLFQKAAQSNSVTT